MHSRRQPKHLRALAPIVALLAVGVPLVVLRPAQVSSAVSPSTWTPIADELLVPVQLQALSSPARLAASIGLVARDREGRDSSPLPRSESAVGRPEPRSSIAQARPPKGTTHVVASGDDLWTIARRHSASLDGILRWNTRADPARLVAGQRIFVPGGSKMKPVPSRATASTLRTGTKSLTLHSTSRPRSKPSALRPTSAPRLTGRLLWPLPVRGIITRRYSAAHPGIDISAPTGTPVRAIEGGTVSWAGWKDNGGGFVVVIRHANGMVSTYNHNSRVLVAVGQSVGRGLPVALVGATGWATGPHLDLRIEMGGRYVDPNDLL